MKNSLRQMLCVIFLLAFTCANSETLIDYAVRQYNRAIADIETGIQYPTDGDPFSSTWNVTTHRRFNTGFYSGILWLLYKYTGNNRYRQLAEVATEGNIGTINSYASFVVLPSFGNGYELTHNSSYPSVIIEAANNVTNRYEPSVGVIFSAYNDALADQYGGNSSSDVINESALLLVANQFEYNETRYNIAISNAVRLTRDLIRSDGSTYRDAQYNTTDGSLIRLFNDNDAYAQWSTSARGHAYVVIGLTNVYKLSRIQLFLRAAKLTANFYIRNAPSDGIPFWDYDVPQTGYVPRDTSAASMLASSLYDLYSETFDPIYLNAANHIMNSLSSTKYRANGNPNYRIPALIVNGTDFEFGSSLALIEGEYYYFKSLLNYGLYRPLLP